MASFVVFWPIIGELVNKLQNVSEINCSKVSILSYISDMNIYVEKHLQNVEFSISSVTSFNLVG